MADRALPQADTPISPRSVPVWTLVFFLALAAVSLLLHVEKSRRRAGIRKARAQLASMASARPIDKVKAARTRFYETRYYLDYPAAVSYAVADLILRLDGIVPPLRLLGIQVDPGLDDLKFKLTVGVAASGPESARRRFIVFFNGLRDLAGITQASFSVPDRTDDGLHVFSIRGRAEWQ
jgi:hypothetical protein